jgi:hypothetical protein
MSALYVAGLGAVSPAGWGVPALREALEKNEPLPIKPLARPGWNKPLRSRQVPPSRPAFLAHPRLRRSSQLTHYAAASALEALAGLSALRERKARLGLIVCLHSGCVQYSCRLFEEILADPTTASPMLFPETVFAAPASHVAALLEHTPLVYTLMGDPASFLQGLSLAADWLEAGKVEAAVVVGGEETNWMRADALWHLEHAAIISDGAGAVCLSPDPAISLGVKLEAITDAHTFQSNIKAPGLKSGANGSTHAHFDFTSSPWKNRGQAACAMRQQLPAGSAAELLCDGIGDSARTDAAERAAWQDWPGRRLSPKRILGEGLMAAAAWQCVAAADAVARSLAPAANISLVGCNQQAIGCRFLRTEGAAQIA